MTSGTRTGWPAGMTAPATCHLFLFALLPFGFALWMSLHDWSLLSLDPVFSGMANFHRLLGDGAFWRSILRTGIFTGLVVPPGLALALAVALALHRYAPGRRILQSGYFLPVVVSSVAVSLVWQWILHAEFGLLNRTLEGVGLQGIPWLHSRVWALIAIAGVTIWKGLGYQILILFAGLQGVPQRLYEAAALDGAGLWNQTRRLSLPLLYPTVYFVAITSVIASFQVFTTVYMMTEGGPAGGTDVVGYHVFRTAFSDYRLGYAAAQSLVVFGLLGVLTLLQVRLMRRRYLEIVSAHAS